MWEIPALAMLMELRSRAALKDAPGASSSRALRARHGQALVEDRAPARAAPA